MFEDNGQKSSNYINYTDRQINTKEYEKPKDIFFAEINNTKSEKIFSKVTNNIGNLFDYNFY